MSEQQVRLWLGLGLICGHLFAIITVGVFFVMGGFSFQEMLTALGLMSPMFLGYVSLIVTYFVENRYVTTDDSPPVGIPFAVVSAAPAAVFVLLLLVCTWLKANNQAFADFDEYKSTLMALEAAFAVYLGKSISKLFEQRRPSRPVPRRPETAANRNA